jgi:hypothetical protein
MRGYVTVVNLARKYNAAKCHEINIEPVAEYVSAQG